MKLPHDVRRLALRGPLTLLLLALVPGALVGACATAVDNQVGTTGTGGDGSGGGGGGTTTTSTGGPDAGPCIYAEDCEWIADICNVGTCINGTCTKSPANDGTPCDDGLYCTEGDVCSAGQCVGGAQKFCPSTDNCHIGACIEATQSCGSAPGNDGAQCDDGDLCTGQGSCFGGTCTKGTQLDCSIFDSQCSKGVCKPGQGCVPEPLADGAACDDGKGPFGCSEGKCQAGTCQSFPKNEGAFCDDNQFCTINDACKSGKCSGDPNPCAPPENPCLIGVCNENSKSCQVTIGNEGNACSDGNPCTSGETCASGQCVGGQPSNEGMACDDANGCTGGTTCAGGQCVNATSEILACTTGDQCCPKGCMLDSDADCLYWASGVQTNVAPATLQGWTPCYGNTYADFSTSVSTMLQSCSKSKLLMACRKVGAPTWAVVAMAPKTDVAFDTGTGNVPHNANGVGWYFNSSYSWGFAQQGDPINRSSCDTEASSFSPGANGDKRICWHTSGGHIDGGWRCGTADNLNGDGGWERVLFHAD